jgi:hypothetical protein
MHNEILARFLTCRRSHPAVEHQRRRAGWAILAAALALLAGLSACAARISRYDAVSYATLTSLKAEVATLVESFDEVPAAQNKDAIARVRLALRKATEYERGKGAPNQPSVDQMIKLSGLYETTVKDYLTSTPGTLGARFFREAARQLEQAFDIVISTEASKNPAREEEQP